MKTKFDDLVGRVVDFFGVDNNTFCIRQVPMPTGNARLAFEAIEDENDGYRSMCEDVVSVPLKGRIFFREPVARCWLKHDVSIDGYKLVDCDDQNHVWLRFGTNRDDHDYPCFIFAYDPRVCEPKIHKNVKMNEKSITGTMSKKHARTILDRIENEGFHYAFHCYSEFYNVTSDKKFHELRLAYLAVADELEDYLYECADD